MGVQDVIYHSIFQKVSQHVQEHSIPKYLTDHERPLESLSSNHLYACNTSEFATFADYLVLLTWCHQDSASVDVLSNF